ncbi:NADPH-dependent FMN reductase [Wenjunlia tyrosinilytica]|uniref:NAD(P)H-dependent oxidoreductase n=1 Tax=Wenjunlia tyrosinilytica TaxID=1544741 RepID=A0A918DW22_9ACTN|nr:NADPH-dependent FMN reductase [Wenjunlia tyrosinilytica]GGO85207.1 NAD(P)H-dependent oxidoreductase [Wenjunlia tyrosinilytica]
MKFFALCGSLRDGSLNAAVLRTAAGLCPPGTEFSVHPDLARLPFFNHDDELAGPPAVVKDLRAQVGEADGVVIASPEYAAGTSGVLKNALEWLVGGVEIADKPVVIVTASPSGGYEAQKWLRQTLTMMSARVLPESLPIPAAASKIADGRVVDEGTLRALEELMAALARAARE